MSQRTGRVDPGFRSSDGTTRSARRSRSRRLRLANAAGLFAGFGLDAVIGDPARLHPVAGYGHWAAAVERRSYAPTRPAGLRHTAIAVGVPVAAAGVAVLATRRRPLARALLVAAATWAVLGGNSLRREASAMADRLTAGDLVAARDQLPNLCGRDPAGLTGPELARATVESVAENSSDAEVAPLVWGALAGLPGLIGYRAVNTLDAMVGHRNERYRRFGTASARLDDLANLVPSRLTALLTVLVAPAVGGRRGRALRIWLRDGHRHPSPNAGQCEAAMAGALGRRLGGKNIYFGQVEARSELGDGPVPDADDVRRAASVSRLVGLSALALCLGHVLAGGLRTALLQSLRARRRTRRRGA